MGEVEVLAGEMNPQVEKILAANIRQTLHDRSLHSLTSLEAKPDQEVSDRWILDV